MADNWDKARRDAAPDTDWAVPGKKKLRIDDATHTRLAWDMVDRTGDLSDAERAEARARILRRAKDLGIDTADWTKALRHAAALSLTAMSLEVPAVPDHPNRMPFSGVLTRLDQPSDTPVGGAGGKRTIMSRQVAQAALPSLLGMGVDFKPSLDGHDEQRKIGTITAATIDGDALRIEGFLYCADFPEECRRIKAEKDALGFSMEIRAETVAEGDLLRIVGGTFTGAAVLYKNKAAYETTSLAAATAEEIAMTADELKALLGTTLGPLTDQVKAIGTELAALKAGGTALHANKEMRERIAPHAQRLRDCAASFEAAGIGLHSEHGHVRVLHHMAAHMEAAAARGETPYIYRDNDWAYRAAASPAAAAPPARIEDAPAFKALSDQLAVAVTKITDLQAAAFQAAAVPARKTASAESLHLLAKGGIKEAPAEPMSEHAVDKMLEAAGILSTDKRIAAKLQLARDGLLARQH